MKIIEINYFLNYKASSTLKKTISLHEQHLNYNFKITSCSQISQLETQNEC